jgi:DNA mismatch endonuclease, patch repair protein
MRAVRRADTTPELLVRQTAHRLGLRFRLHRRDLPGTPDLVFPGLRAAVFVHGCFWHRHARCSRATTPRTRVDFWTDKFESNVSRDRRKSRNLRSRGWKVLVIWECEAHRPNILAEKMRALLQMRRDKAMRSMRPERERRSRRVRSAS